MLKDILFKSKQNLFLKIIQTILDSKFLIVFIAMMAAISNLFSLEILCLYTYLSIVIIAVLFGDDLLCSIPIACCGYYTFSRVNNPLSNEMTSIFLERKAITHLIIILVTTAIFAITRLIYDLITKKHTKKFPKLTFGFIAIGITYIIGGIFSEFYDLKTAFFGFTQIAAISFCYFYFYYTVDFKKVNNSYFAFLTLVIGLLLLSEAIGMLYFCNFFSSQPFNRYDLYTGWGINNNVAAAICMVLPAPFYYSYKKNYGFIFLILANIMMLVLLFIQSRNGILIGTILFIVLYFITLIKSNIYHRLQLIITQVLLLFIFGILIIEFDQIIAAKLASILSVGTSDNGRFEIYIDGINQFLNYPFFGNGFYQCNNFRWGNNEIGSFFPARYHNTFIQLLASCGIVSLIAYFYHRLQTIKIVFSKINTEKLYMFFIFIALALTSILDCNFFNFGPGFLYSTILLLVEINNINSKNLKLN